MMCYSLVTPQTLWEVIHKLQSVICIVAGYVTFHTEHVDLPKQCLCVHIDNDLLPWDYWRNKEFFRVHDTHHTVSLVLLHLQPHIRKKSGVNKYWPISCCGASPRRTRSTAGHSLTVKHSKGVTAAFSNFLLPLSELPSSNWTCLLNLPGVTSYKSRIPGKQVQWAQVSSVHSPTSRDALLCCPLLVSSSTISSSVIIILLKSVVGDNPNYNLYQELSQFWCKLS